MPLRGFHLLTSESMPAFSQMMSSKQMLGFIVLVFWLPAACQSVAARKSRVIFFPYTLFECWTPHFIRGYVGGRLWFKCQACLSSSVFPLKVILTLAFPSPSWFHFYSSTIYNPLPCGQRLVLSEQSCCLVNLVNGHWNMFQLPWVWPVLSLLAWWVGTVGYQHSSVWLQVSLLNTWFNVPFPSAV